MAHFDNQSTRIEQTRLRDEFDAGLVEGYEASLNPLPTVAYKSLRNLTARERGYALGWLLKMDELAGGTE